MSQQKPIARAVTEESAAPIYDRDEQGFFWRCPYCKLKFRRRKPCESHMGMKPNIPASCPVLREQAEARRQGV